jgi:hypothetical protein
LKVRPEAFYLSEGLSCSRLRESIEPAPIDDGGISRHRRRRSDAPPRPQALAKRFYVFTFDDVGCNLPSRHTDAQHRQPSPLPSGAFGAPFLSAVHNTDFKPGSRGGVSAREGNRLPDDNERSQDSLTVKSQFLSDFRA